MGQEGWKFADTGGMVDEVGVCLGAEGRFVDEFCLSLIVRD